MNSVHNAQVLYRWIAGHKSISEDDNRSKSWVPGKLEPFSNIDPDTLEPKDILPTLLVHSKITEEFQDSVESKKVIAEQLELRAPGQTRKQAQETIRRIFQTVGQPGKLGEHIRCIISVSMLSEGWDAKTVTHVLGYRKFASMLLCEQVIGRALRRTCFDDPYLPEYADIFGIPYPGLRGISNDTEVVIHPPYQVQSNPEKTEFRLSWPHIERLDWSPPTGARLIFVPDRACAWNPLAPDLSGGVEVGPKAGVGERELYTLDSRRQHAIYSLASELILIWETDNDSQLNRKGILFVGALSAVKQWLSLPQVNVRAEHLFDTGLLIQARDKLRECCVSEDGLPAERVLVFANDLDRSEPRTSNTQHRAFQTTLLDRYPNCKKSELSDAACHSASEVRIAKWLDHSCSVKSWVRNFRLGWRIPWWDYNSSMWREYEPDFLVSLASEHRHFVVLEMKGVENAASKAKEEAAISWCKALTVSTDPVAEGVWSYVLITDPREIDQKIHSLMIKEWHHD